MDISMQIGQKNKNTKDSTSNYYFILAKGVIH